LLRIVKVHVLKAVLKAPATKKRFRKEQQYRVQTDIPVRQTLPNSAFVLQFLSFLLFGQSARAWVAIGHAYD